ncbi:hypothetical protein BP00DRAFT_421750 [Aspergillus indologenus CBS 114.80]|uniref:Uncharacterized protein n=1 Tax=Aspergillus indologenus CBS 114.80 TaxID=1450541 RepID=A0A2V5IM23_9EURO|nr:hypothetical protein BP00DRAFT_421750 [Aspergillus indologenus CBS 114.80]
MSLREHGVCEREFVPFFDGHIDWIDPTAFYPALQHFAEFWIKIRDLKTIQPIRDTSALPGIHFFRY